MRFNGMLNILLDGLRFPIGTASASLALSAIRRALTSNARNVIRKWNMIRTSKIPGVEKRKNKESTARLAWMNDERKKEKKEKESGRPRRGSGYEVSIPQLPYI